MAPKKRFSKQQIADAAFEIAVQEGVSGITIRKVAARLGSSIAPIYANFLNVEALIDAVMIKIDEVSRTLLAQQASGDPFRDIGIASMRFAKQYSVLFRDLLLTRNDRMKNYNEKMGPVLVEQMKQDPILQHFSDEELMLMLNKLRVFQLGLSVMVANQPNEMSEQQAIHLLDSIAADVITAAHMKQERG